MRGSSKRPTATAQDHQALIQNLNTQVGQIKAEINAVSQQMNRMPRFRGRYLQRLCPGTECGADWRIAIN